MMTRSEVVSVLDGYSRAAIPVALTLVFVLLGVLPYGVPYIAPVFPAFTLMAVYFWTIYRPDLFPAVAVFAVGIFQDVLNDMPLGLSALVLLLVYGFVISQGRVFLGKSYLVVWSGFAVVAAGASLIGWTVASLRFATFIEPGSFAIQLLLSVALYPCVSWLFVFVQRKFLSLV